MIPYYDEDGVTIYHGDCREILPNLAPVDLLLTDPPYLGLKGNIRKYSHDGVAPRRRDSVTVAEPWGRDISSLSLVQFLMGAMVFCSYHSVASLPNLIEDAETAGLLAWYQRNTMPPLNNAPHHQVEFVWLFRRAPGLQWRKLTTHIDEPRLSAGCVSSGERFTNPDGSVLHPAQKPLAVIGRLLAVAPSSVIDPYMGTGTTLEAAKLRNIRAIGIEIEERYCEVAAKRLSQRVLDLPALAPEEEK